MNSNKTILHLCADIGSDSKPYRDAGYSVICVGKDIDVHKFDPPEEVYGIIANPPCTMFSFCRTSAKLPRDLMQGMELVEACLKIIWQVQYRTVNEHAKYTRLKFWCLENPYFGLLRFFLGKPALIYDPWEYGDNYQKRTALWGNFNEPQKTHKSFVSKGKWDHVQSKDIHPEYFGKLTREERRSVCSEKFAKAFFEANQ